MTAFSPIDLLQILRAHGLGYDARLCVAFSGGLDSTVLVHALASLAPSERMFELRAVHVDHQLHRDSAAWSAHCEAVCASLEVPFVCTVVSVQPQGEGLEAAARRARYEALRCMLRAGEILLTAHHADDQLETVLLALVRGAGVNGLSAAPVDQPFGPGRLLRPLLAFTRTQLLEWARAQRLQWVEDPSNDNVDQDRNFLRARVLPVLKERWPAAPQTAARSAAHLGDARRLLSALAAADLERLRRGQALDAQGLLELDSARRRNALRAWLHERGARSPSTRKLDSIESDLLNAGADRTPAVAWDQVVLRRYRGQLYLEPRQPSARYDAFEWDHRHPVTLPANCGVLRVGELGSGPIDRSRLAPTLTVRFRRGGELIRPVGDAHHRDLKKLLQRAGVPPWRRERIPLVYSDDRLVCVGDLWVAEEFAAHNSPGVAVVWERDG